jgi:hypothetical protein
MFDMLLKRGGRTEIFLRDGHGTRDTGHTDRRTEVHIEVVPT